MTEPGASAHEPVTLRALLEEPLLRTATVETPDDETLDRLVSWCLPWSVAVRGSEAVQHVLVHLDAEPTGEAGQSIPHDLALLTSRGAAGLAVNATKPGAALRDAAREAGLPLLGLPADTSHLALSRLVAEKNLANAAHVLRYGVTVHHTLGEVLYRGAGLAAMANQVRRISGCSVVVLDSHLEVLVTDVSGRDEAAHVDQVASRMRSVIAAGELAVDAHGKASTVVVDADGGEVTVVTAPIVLGGTTYGWLLLVESEHPPRRHDLAQHLVLAGEAATITGSEMLRLRSVEAAEERARGDFVHALLHARFSSPHEVASRADHHGFDIGASYGVVAVHGAFDTTTPAGLERQSGLIRIVRTMSAGSDRPVLVTAVGDLLAVVAQLGPGRSPRDVHTEQDMLASFARRISEEVRRRTRGNAPTTFGRPALGADGVAASYREARVALGVAQRLGITEPCGYAELHAYAALVELTRSRQALSFARDVLEPLREREQSDDGLLKVVLTYIESGGNVNAAARKLHLHRNTMFYKLERASRLLRLDLREPESMFTIWLAHRIDLLASVEAEVTAELGSASEPSPDAEPDDGRNAPGPA